MAVPQHHSAPYRTPCNGWTRPQYRGPCYNHKRLAETAVPIYENVTLLSGVQPENGDVTDLATVGDACTEGDTRADGNCYHATEETHDFSACHKVGWKA